jgi:hypothetical protein
MLARLLSLLGWNTAPSGRPSRYQAPRRTESATAHLFTKHQGPVANGKTAAGHRPAKPNASGPTGFNPYNTGKFDRSASWERISKTQK